METAAVPAHHLDRTSSLLLLPLVWRVEPDRARETELLLTLAIPALCRLRHLSLDRVAAPGRPAAALVLTEGLCSLPTSFLHRLQLAEVLLHQARDWAAKAWDSARLPMWDRTSLLLMPRAQAKMPERLSPASLVPKSACLLHWIKDRSRCLRRAATKLASAALAEGRASVAVRAVAARWMVLVLEPPRLALDTVLIRMRMPESPPQLVRAAQEMQAQEILRSAALISAEEAGS